MGCIRRSMCSIMEGKERKGRQGREMKRLTFFERTTCLKQKDEWMSTVKGFWPVRQGAYVLYHSFSLTFSSGRTSRQGKEWQDLRGISMTLLPAPTMEARWDERKIDQDQSRKWLAKRLWGSKRVLVIYAASTRPGIIVPRSNVHSSRLTICWQWYFIGMGFYWEWLLMSVTLLTWSGLCSASHLLTLQSSLKQVP